MDSVDCVDSTHSTKTGGFSGLDSTRSTHSTHSALLCFFSKTKSDSDSFLFAEENPLVGQSHSKRNFAETIFLFEISTFFGSTTPSRAIHYFFDHIQTEMIENLFHEGHEQKTFSA